VERAQYQSLEIEAVLACRQGHHEQRCQLPDDAFVAPLRDLQSVMDRAKDCFPEISM
jgi:hypothetical protein